MASSAHRVVIHSINFKESESNAPSDQDVVQMIAVFPFIYGVAHVTSCDLRFDLCEYACSSTNSEKSTSEDETAIITRKI